MARVTTEDCIEKEPNRFKLVMLAAQRAKELSNGDYPTVELDNDKHTVVALREIAEGTQPVDSLHQRAVYKHQKHAETPPLDEEEFNFQLGLDSSDYGGIKGTRDFSFTPFEDDMGSLNDEDGEK
ncbi:MAG: DNA-directed RNA polymerase subunit omega [Rhodobacteraceae bacterium]|nr:DNA-directed RNA polymerase subunit omega [Paracoccaceae bacterium]MYF45301.1 DNA-directed RNA polymerase subunit omega [Paracoccaceae bacterium]MYG09970.1 DNA-directed RNA polymerase subunit omega [Paracoccaceae bacterium]MYI91687.1 DNA-directed RNA polymerase subunit omega [Paracoccaceae bacterium]MYJ87278.1 DNA-directed RNA polymerase subunit omega [Paracoccaceae bacterium]